MKRLVFATVPWMVLAQAASGSQVRMADVLYTHYDDVPMRAFRLGDECFVPIEDVTRWGWQAELRSGSILLRADGKEIPLPMRTFSGRQTLPLRIASQRLGVRTEWDEINDTLYAVTELAELSAKDGKLKVSAPHAFRPKATLLSNPNRVILDLHGVRMGSTTKKSLDIDTRVMQFRPNITRIIFELKGNPDLDRVTAVAAREFEIDIRANEPVVPIERPPVDPTVTPPVEEKVPEVLPTPVTAFLPLTLQSETNSRLNLQLAFGAKLKAEAQARKPEPTILEVTFPGVAMGLAPDFALGTETVQAVETRVTGDSTVLVLKFARPLGAEVVTNGANVQIQVVKPEVGDGKLAGKVVVVDPGHGGHDGGAKAGGVTEKELNLKIGTLISEALLREGATVIMTRKTDVFIPLNQRAKIAQSSNADFFISTHINSTGGTSSQSGTITFFHKNRPVGKVLAECIHKEIALVNKLPNIGVWSDGKIYNSGFAVLRQTTMPGVLLELGFINHPKDRARMVTEDFQKSVASAVVRGIKVFLGDAQKND